MVFSGQRDEIPEIVPTVSDFYPEFIRAEVPVLELIGHPNDE